MEGAKASEKKEWLTTQREYLEQYSEEQVQIFSDYNEMLKLPNLDMISICTPPFVHAPVTIAAAQAGKHVYCEKPMAMTATEAKAKRGGAFLLVYKRRIVELQLSKVVLEALVVDGIDGINATIHHRSHFLEPI